MKKIIALLCLCTISTQYGMEKKYTLNKPVKIFKPVPQDITFESNGRLRWTISIPETHEILRKHGIEHSNIFSLSVSLQEMNSEFEYVQKDGKPNVIEIITFLKRGCTAGLFYDSTYPHTLKHMIWKCDKDMTDKEQSKQEKIIKAFSGEILKKFIQQRDTLEKAADKELAEKKKLMEEAEIKEETERKLRFNKKSQDKLLREERKREEEINELTTRFKKMNTWCQGYREELRESRQSIETSLRKKNPKVTQKEIDKAIAEDVDIQDLEKNLRECSHSCKQIDTDISRLKGFLSPKKECIFGIEVTPDDIDE